jgi:hypothetical protein
MGLTKKTMLFGLGIPVRPLTGRERADKRKLKLLEALERGPDEPPVGSTFWEQMRRKVLGR